jgi:hypothetical protein
LYAIVTIDRGTGKIVGVRSVAAGGPVHERAALSLG